MKATKVRMAVARGLLLGLAVTLLVAVAASLRAGGDGDLGTRVTYRGAPDSRYLTTNQFVGLLRSEAIVSSVDEMSPLPVTRPLAEVPEWMGPDGLLPMLTEEVPPTVVVRASGWPALALRGSAWLHFDEASRQRQWRARRGVLVLGPAEAASSWDLSQLRMVPLIPMWRGIIVNTLLWAVLFEGVVRAWATLRNWLRGQRGKCPACGYSRAGLAGDAACPECGAIDKMSKPPPSAPATSAGSTGGTGH